MVNVCRASVREAIRYGNHDVVKYNDEFIELAAIIMERIFEHYGCISVSYKNLLDKFNR